jgi:hypothetical protein
MVLEQTSADSLAYLEVGCGGGGAIISQVRSMQGKLTEEEGSVQLTSSLK